MVVILTPIVFNGGWNPRVYIWGFPKMVGFPSKSSIKKIGFSIIFTFQVPPFKEEFIRNVVFWIYNQHLMQNMHYSNLSCICCFSFFPGVLD